MYVRVTCSCELVGVLVYVLSVKVYLLSKEEGGRAKPFTSNFQSQLYCKTWDAPTMMQLPDEKDLIMPGEDSAVTVTVRKHLVSSLYSLLCTVMNTGVTLNNALDYRANGLTDY